MASIDVQCPDCKSTRVIRRGKDPNGKQRYCCLNPLCSKKTFLLEYCYPGFLPVVKKQIIDMAMNGSGIRDTARVLHVSTATVINELKKKKAKSLL